MGDVSYSYLPYASNYAYTAPVAASAPVAAVAAASAAVPVVSAPADITNSQFHAPDDLGQYNYGYSHPSQTKQELKTADGVTRGSYSYVDANGLLQTVNYISDAMGFRVAATNLPVHHVEEPVAQVVPVVEVEAAEATPAVVAEASAAAPVAAAYTSGVITPQVQYSYLPYAQNYGYSTGESGYYGAAAPQATSYYGAAAPVVQAVAAPVVKAAEVAQPAPAVQTVQYAQTPVVQAAPVAAAAPVVAAGPDGSQYHAQDDYGQYSFGYSDGNSVKQEVKTADGIVRGAYSYVDSDGI